MLSGLMCREGCPGILLPKHSNILGKGIESLEQNQMFKPQDH